MTLIKTKAFWLKVKEEYNKQEFICHTSPTFDKAWKGPHKKELEDIAEDFIDAENLVDFCVGFSVLFNGVPCFYPIFSEVRVNFIDYCINKFD